MIKISINNNFYKHLKDAKEKGVKIVLNKNLQEVLLIDINEVDLTNSIFSDINEKQYYFLYIRNAVNALIADFLLQNGNRGKIKLRNLFYKSHKKLWKQPPIW